MDPEVREVPVCQVLLAYQVEGPDTLAAIQDNQLYQEGLVQQARRVYQEALEVQGFLLDQEVKDTQVDLDIQGNQVKGTQGNPVNQGCLEATVNQDSQDIQGSQDNRANLGNQDNQCSQDIQVNLVSHNIQEDQDIQV